MTDIEIWEECFQCGELIKEEDLIVETDWNGFEEYDVYKGYVCSYCGFREEEA